MLGALKLLLILVLTPSIFETAGTPEDADIEGNWGWEWKDEDGGLHKHVLDVMREPTGYVAVERFDEEPPVPVKELTVNGQSVLIEIMRGNRTSIYQGKFVDQDTIQGEVTVTAEGNTNVYSWTATRIVEKPQP